MDRIRLKPLNHLSTQANPESLDCQVVLPDPVNLNQLPNSLRFSPLKPPSETEPISFLSDQDQFNPNQILNYKTQLIFSIVNVVCFSLIFLVAIPGLVFSLKARTLFKKRQFSEADESSRKAKMFNFVCLATGNIKFFHLFHSKKKKPFNLV